MQIKGLDIEQFKGVTATHRPGRHTLYVGPNGSGKTTRLEAIAYALTGKTSVGDRPDAVMVFASHPSGLAVRVALDDGFTFERRCRKDQATQRVSTEMRITSLPAVADGAMPNGTRAIDVAVAAHVGRFAPMFDINAFLGLSPDKRRDFVLRLCGAEAGKATDVLALVKIAYLRAELGPGTWDALVPTHGEDVEIIATARLREAEQVHLADLIGYAGGALKLAAHDDVAAQLVTVLQTFKVEASEAKRDVERGHAAAQQLSERKAQLEIGTETVEALSEKMKELRAERRRLQDEIQTVRGRNDGIESARKTIADVDARLDTVRDKLAGAMTVDVDGETVRLEALQKAQRDDNEAHNAACRANNQQHTDAVTKLAQLGEWRRSAGRAIEQARAGQTEMRGAIEAVESGPVATIAENVGRLFEWLGEGIGTHEVRRYVEAIRGAVKQLDRREEYRTALHEHGNVLLKAEDELAESATSHELCETKIADLQERAAELDVPVGTDRVDEIKKLAGVIGATTTAVAEHTSTRDHLIGLRAATEKTLQGLTADVATVDIEEAGRLADAMTTELDALAVKCDAAKAYAQLIEEYNKAVADAERSAVRNRVAKSLTDAVRKCRETVMESLVSPIVKRLTEFLDMAAPDAAPYVRLENDRGRPIFDFGWHRDGRTVSFDAMSGGERAMYASALAFALVDIANPPLKLLLLELGEVDAPTLSKILSSIAGVAGDRFQSFVATHNGTAPGGWDEVRLSKGGV